MHHHKLSDYLLLIGIGILWGAQFMLNDIAVSHVPPYVVGTGRAVFAALTMMLLCWVLPKSATQMPTLTMTLAIKYVLIAFFEAIIPFVFIVWGQQYVDSSVAAVLIGGIPIFTGLLVMLFIRGEKITKATVVSIVVGFIGLLILFYPQLLEHHSTSFWGELAILGGAFSFSIALIIIKTLPKVSAVKLTRNVFFIAMVPMLLFSWLRYPHVLSQFTTSSWLAVIGLGVFCSGIVYILFVTLIHRAGATFTALSNYLVPLFGAIFGVVLMNDPVRWNMVLALIVILSSVMFPMLRACFKKQRH